MEVSKCTPVQRNCNVISTIAYAFVAIILQKGVKGNEKTTRRAGGESMNPVLVFLILLAAVALWFLCAFLFYPIGRFIYRIVKDAFEEMNREDKKEKHEE